MLLSGAATLGAGGDVADVFDAELRIQLTEARKALATAVEAGDEYGAQACRGRVAGLLRIAAQHGMAVPCSPEEEEES
jgi:hypothetical protein